MRLVSGSPAPPLLTPTRSSHLAISHAVTEKSRTFNPSSSRPLPTPIPGPNRPVIAVKPRNDIIGAGGCALSWGATPSPHRHIAMRDRGTLLGRRSGSLEPAFARKSMSKMTSRTHFSGVVLCCARKAAVLRCKYIVFWLSDEGCGRCEIAMRGPGLWACTMRHVCIQYCAFVRSYKSEPFLLLW